MAGPVSPSQDRRPVTAAELLRQLTGRRPAGRDAALLAAQLAHAQRLGNMGWAQWDLRTGEALWSDHVYVIFGRDPGAGPAALADLARYLEPGDEAVLEELLRAVADQAAPAHAELRIRRDGELRNLRMVLEPLPEPDGPAGVHGVIQDITGRRRAERIMSEQRARAAEDRTVMLTLREAILPAHAALELPGARVAVRYVPAEQAANLGGDWFEAAALPDGRALLAIGDVSGHGLPAIAHMAQLRHALLGLAMTGRPADRLLAWLNELVVHRLPETTATAVIGHLDPRTRVFAWARAGHLAPILIRDGAARQLAPPCGLLLGVAGDQPYDLAATPLRPGDVLLLFTDGLVERRAQDLDEGLDAALRAARGLPPRDLDAALDRLLEGIGGPNPEDDACLLAVGILG
ncbi:PP2C family protein-serine/threonine phosphatase [Thermoactinospora rubra]|uniref:PP2C family protein-serine/threonine phosphatase n=1 Tax=Thermoactinospora rubra TaxID=1088767 RepID=UPI000A11208F|nr:SpoIIE family protein phosphatase [Thermoactinospora rubra]